MPLHTEWRPKLRCSNSELDIADGLGFIQGVTCGIRVFLTLFIISGVACLGQLKRCENVC